MKFFLPSILLASLAVAQAQRTPLDTRWIASASGTPNAPLLDKVENDPRFLPLLRQAFPQHQWFWYDHGRFVPTADLVQTFLAHPREAISGDQSLTLTGCVPHDCTDNGLLWIDTAPGNDSTRMIFAANPLVSGGSGSHLWLFTSGGNFNWQKPDGNFRTQLGHWLSTLTTGLPAPNARQRVTLITVVRPDGRQEDLAPENLLQQQPGAPQ